MYMFPDASAVYVAPSMVNDAATACEVLFISFTLIHLRGMYVIAAVTEESVPIVAVPLWVTWLSAENEYVMTVPTSPVMRYEVEVIFVAVMLEENTTLESSLDFAETTFTVVEAVRCV